MQEIRVEKFKDRVSRGIFTETHIARLTNLPMMLHAETQTIFIQEVKKLRFDIEKKSGIDKSIQIEENMVFNFDKEAEPIVRVLTSNVIEEALLEALDEDETEFIHKKRLSMTLFEEERVKQMKQFQIEEVKKKKFALLCKGRRQDKLHQQVEIHKKLLSRMVSKSFFKVVSEDVQRKVTDLKMSPVDWLQKKIQDSVVNDIQDKIYGKLRMKDDVRELLRGMMGKAKQVYADDYKHHLNIHNE